MNNVTKFYLELLKYYFPRPGRKFGVQCLPVVDCDFGFCKDGNMSLPQCRKVVRKQQFEKNDVYCSTT